MAHYRRTRLAMATVGIAALLATGCSLNKSRESGQAIDPPPTDAQAMIDTATKATVEQTMPVTLYMKDAKGYVAPVTMNLPKTFAPATKALEYMVEDGPGKAITPSGFTALLPKGTKIKGVNIMADKKLAVIDFSKEFESYNAQDERKIMEAVTWTMTGFPTVEKVQIWVEGRALKEMPVHGMPLESELSRAMGINIEMTNGVNIGQSTPVTLYFVNQTSDQFTYYVPVTRMIKRTDDVAKAALEQLILGPSSNKGLASVMAPETGVLKIIKSDDTKTITVDFNDKLLGSDKKLPAQAVQAVILSLIETTGFSKVQLMVNGDAKLTGTDNQSYTKPVARPANINPVKL